MTDSSLVVWFKVNSTKGRYGPTLSENFTVDTKDISGVSPNDVSEDDLQAIVKGRGQKVSMVIIDGGEELDPTWLCERVRKATYASVFVAVVTPLASESCLVRERLFQCGANMVTCGDDSNFVNAISRLKWIDNNVGPYSCPKCRLKNLSEDALCLHHPLHHIDAKNYSGKCPVCKRTVDNMQVHINNRHGAVARGEAHGDHTPAPQAYLFALVVCRRPSDGKYLVVQEFAGQGFWFPGGRVDAGESLVAAAERETLEEAGVPVRVEGVVKFEFDSRRVVRHGFIRSRIIFFAVPLSDTRPKSLPDYESAGACWATVNELEKVPLRGRDALEYIRYVDEGGIIHPLSVLAETV